MTVIEARENYPLNLKFGRHRTTTNEKIVLASMFSTLYALAVQLSPETGSSGIQELETDTFKLHCSQTLTGVKFLVVCDPKQVGVDQLLQSGDADGERLPHPLGGQLREGRAHGLVEAAEAEAGGEVGVDGVVGAQEVQLWKSEFTCQNAVGPLTDDDFIMTFLGRS